MAHARATTGQVDWSTAVTTGRHSLVADEPASMGAQDADPAPVDLSLKAGADITTTLAEAAA